MVCSATCCPNNSPSKLMHGKSTSFYYTYHTLRLPNYTMAMIQIHKMRVVNSLSIKHPKNSVPMIPLQTHYHTQSLHTLPLHTMSITLSHTSNAWPCTPSTILLPKQQMHFTKTPTFE
jgi:hypothetical protein